MNTRAISFSIAGVIAIAGIVWFAYAVNGQPQPYVDVLIPPAPAATSTVQTVSDGTISFSYEQGTTSMAVTPEQILVKSYIPACDPGFDYCLYYGGKDYQGTNFEAAGLRIEKRESLSSETTCLATAPTGYASSTKPATTHTSAAYSTSVFPNVGDAAAGHYAVGSLYRLYVKSGRSCYEFATRIAETQFANYPPGSVREFSAADAASVQSLLDGMLATVSLATGETNLFGR